MYEVAKAVADNPSLIAEFDMDPEAAAKKINAFQVTPGFRMHIADGENSYHPPEDDALSQISGQVDESVWSRIEIRAGVGAVACIVCLGCKVGRRLGIQHATMVFYAAINGRRVQIDVSITLACNKRICLRALAKQVVLQEVELAQNLCLPARAICQTET